jgi:hypothetical protein
VPDVGYAYFWEGKMKDTKAGAEGERGPGWFDVYDYAKALEEHWHSKVEWEIHTTVSVNNRWGIHITARLKAYPVRFGTAGFGTAYGGSGQKTMSAALWHALYRLDADMARLDMEPPQRDESFPW